MKCERCLNTDPAFFYTGHRGTYCRRCIHLGGYQVESLDEIDGVISNLPFELSTRQKELSKRVAEVGLTHDVLIEAVCGAGKTECVIELIEKAMSANLHVGWMIARRQVVLQLKERLASIFPNQKVIAVCEGFTTDLTGQLVLLTAHQLYRYPHKFDVLIIDEPDAFPYKGNQLLSDLAQVASKKTKIYLTATPDEELLKMDCVHLKLDKRPHGRDLVVPKVVTVFKSLQMLVLIRALVRYRNEKVLIFTPTIKQARRLGKLLRLPVLTSKTVNKQEILNRFESNQEGKLLCTTILERGMTFSEVFVIVINAHHPVFDEASLIQISGRVGRSFTKTKGECLFIATQKSRSIRTCINRIRAHNAA